MVFSEGAKKRQRANRRAQYTFCPPNMSQQTKCANSLPMNCKFLNVWIRIWPFLWFAWVVALSLRLSWRQLFHTNGPLHFPGHALIFGFSAFAACRSIQSSWQRLFRSLAIIALGLTLKVAESKIFGKPLEWEDVLTDATGVILFLLAAAWIDSSRKPGPLSHRVRLILRSLLWSGHSGRLRVLRKNIRQPGKIEARGSNYFPAQKCQIRPHGHLLTRVAR